MGITRARLEEVKRFLATVPANDDPARILSRQAVVAELATEIASLQERAYSIEEIARLLKSQEIAISVHTLRTYLTRIRAQQLGAKKSSKTSSIRTSATGTPEKLKAQSKTEKETAQASGQQRPSDEYQDSQSRSASHATRTLQPDQHRLGGRGNDGSPGLAQTPLNPPRDSLPDGNITGHSPSPGNPLRTHMGSPVRTAPRTTAQTSIHKEDGAGSAGQAGDPPRKLTTPPIEAPRNRPTLAGTTRVTRSSSFDPAPDTPDI